MNVEDKAPAWSVRESDLVAILIDDDIITCFSKSIFITFVIMK